MSGNKILFFLGISFLAACSPKTTPQKSGKVKPAPDRERERPILEKEPENTSSPEKSPKTTQPEMVISLVLPFELSSINYRTAGFNELSKAEIALDFYQGFKLGLDSIAHQSGTNFKLQVYDSKDDPANVGILAAKAGIKNSDLIIGPVFPNGMKAFSAYSKAMKKLVVSPLAATSPEVFNNPYLVTVNNSLEQHVHKAVDFIKTELKPQKIILIRSGQADEYKYANPFKKEISENMKSTAFAEIGIKAVGIENVFKSLSPTGLNVVVLPATDRTFLLAITKELDKLRSNFKIAVIGHPNWEKASFLDVSLLQRLNTYVTSSYKIDYKSNRISRFVANYKGNFSLEPGEYAFKGFDIAYYFGQLMAKKNKNFDELIGKENYDGLHNDFNFKRNESYGFYNDELMMIKY